MSVGSSRPEGHGVHERRLRRSESPPDPNLISGYPSSVFLNSKYGFFLS